MVALALRWFHTLAVIFFLLPQASATVLEFETIYPECMGDQETMTDFEESVRCSCYFLAPNFHVRTFNNLVREAFFDSLMSGGMFIFNQVTAGINSFFGDDGLIYSGDPKKGAEGILNFGLVLASPVVIIWGFVSAVAIYTLLIVWEFLKTYLIIGVSWSLWSRVIFGEVKWSGWLHSNFGALLISLFLIVGTVVLLALDITVWGVL